MRCHVTSPQAWELGRCYCFHLTIRKAEVKWCTSALQQGYSVTKEKHGGRRAKEAENDQNRVKYSSLGQRLGAAMTRNVGYGMNRAGPCCYTRLVLLCG